MFIDYICYRSIMEDDSISLSNDLLRAARILESKTGSLMSATVSTLIVEVKHCITSVRLHCQAMCTGKLFVMLMLL